jgi:hypothetical protein
VEINVIEYSTDFAWLLFQDLRDVSKTTKRK